MPKTLAVVDRLRDEFGSHLPTSVLAEVVVQCAIDLAGTAPLATSQVVERLARQRLTFLDSPQAWTA